MKHVFSLVVFLSIAYGVYNLTGHNLLVTMLVNSLVVIPVLKKLHIF